MCQAVLTGSWGSQKPLLEQLSSQLFVQIPLHTSPLAGTFSQQQRWLLASCQLSALHGLVTAAARTGDAFCLIWLWTSCGPAPCPPAAAQWAHSCASRWVPLPHRPVCVCAWQTALSVAGGWLAVACALCRRCTHTTRVSCVSAAVRLLPAPVLALYVCLCVPPQGAPDKLP